MSVRKPPNPETYLIQLNRCTFRTPDMFSSHWGLWPIHKKRIVELSFISTQGNLRYQFPDVVTSCQLLGTYNIFTFGTSSNSVRWFLCYRLFGLLRDYDCFHWVLNSGEVYKYNESQCIKGLPLFSGNFLTTNLLWSIFRLILQDQK